MGLLNSICNLGSHASKKSGGYGGTEVTNRHIVRVISSELFKTSTAFFQTPMIHSFLDWNHLSSSTVAAAAEPERWQPVAQTSGISHRI
jgi:hypothetical protein